MDMTHVEVTLVHWSEKHPHQLPSFGTFIKPMPLRMQVTVDKRANVPLCFMTTDNDFPHMMPDEHIMQDDKSIKFAVIGVPYSWNGFMVFTWIEMEETTLMALHHDPIQPNELLADFKANNSSRAMFLDLSIPEMT